MATLEGMAYPAPARRRLLDDSENLETGDTDMVLSRLAAPQSRDFCLRDFRAGDLLDTSTVSLVGQYLQSLIAYLTVTSTNNPCTFWFERSMRRSIALALEDEADDALQIVRSYHEANEEPEAVAPDRVPTMEEYVQQVQMWAEMYDQEPVDLTSEELAAYYDRIAPFEPED